MDPDRDGAAIERRCARGINTLSPVPPASAVRES